MFDLSGRKALITGASGGIGSAVVNGLTARGAKVAISGTRVHALESVASAANNDIQIFAADLLAEDGVSNLLASLASADFHPDILVLNAGITRDGLAMRMSDKDWDDVMQTNLRSNFQLVRSNLRSMMKARFGRIIATTSVVGATGNPGQSNYVAAKAGLTGMIKAIALETASRGITANCVAPGYIDTAMTQSINESTKQKMLERIPAGRLGTPDDITGAVVFLASNEASYITGQTIHINGGMASFG